MDESQVLDTLWSSLSFLYGVKLEIVLPDFDQINTLNNHLNYSFSGDNMNRIYLMFGIFIATPSFSITAQDGKISFTGSIIAPSCQISASSIRCFDAKARQWIIKNMDDKLVNPTNKAVYSLTKRNNGNYSELVFTYY